MKKQKTETFTEALYDYREDCEFCNYIPDNRLVLVDKKAHIYVIIENDVLKSFYYTMHSVGGGISDMTEWRAEMIADTMVCTGEWVSYTVTPITNGHKMYIISGKRRT